MHQVVKTVLGLVGFRLNTYELGLHGPNNT